MSTRGQPNGQLLTTREAAARLTVSQDCVRAWCGTIIKRYFKLPTYDGLSVSRLRFSADEIDRVYRELTGQGPPEEFDRRESDAALARWREHREMMKIEARIARKRKREDELRRARGTQRRGRGNRSA